MTKPKGLIERLNTDDHIICAEGYVFEFERRGYLRAGCFVPEVVIEYPELVKSMHEEFVHSGSDIVEAFTYYAHREKMRLIGRGDDLEKVNRNALQIARQVANDTGTLMAGNICNTTIYSPDDKESHAKCRNMFEEQAWWAKEEGADYIIGETFSSLGEAKLALETIKKTGLPAVITFASHPAGGKDQTYDGFTYPEACLALEKAGADVVGLNCTRGPETIIPLMREIRKVCKGHLACIPAPYRTSENDGISMQLLKDPKSGLPSYPADLDPWLLSRNTIADFTREMVAMGVQYLGICCGNRACYTRTMAETLGRTTPASKYSPDMSQHFSQMNKEDFKFTNKLWYATYG